MTIVHLYMGVESSYPRLRKELYSVIDLICTCATIATLIVLTCFVKYSDENLL